jgi:hypothetical protein
VPRAVAHVYPGCPPTRGWEDHILRSEMNEREARAGGGGHVGRLGASTPPIFGVRRQHFLGGLLCLPPPIRLNMSQYKCS